MTRDDIIRMAREAGIDAWWDSGNECREDLQAHLEHFAGLVAAAEREACAKVCDAEGREWDSDSVVTEKNYAAHCAAAIRTRGNQ